MFKDNYIWILQSIYHRELNNHIEIENEVNRSIWLQDKVETLVGYLLDKNFFKGEVWGDILSRKDNVLIKYGCSVNKGGQIL